MRGEVIFGGYAAKQWRRRLSATPKPVVMTALPRDVRADVTALAALNRGRAVDMFFSNRSIGDVRVSFTIARS